MTCFCIALHMSPRGNRSDDPDLLGIGVYLSDMPIAAPICNCCHKILLVGPMGVFTIWKWWKGLETVIHMWYCIFLNCKREISTAVDSAFHSNAAPYAGVRRDHLNNQLPFHAPANIDVFVTTVYRCALPTCCSKVICFLPQSLSIWSGFSTTLALMYTNAEPCKEKTCNTVWEDY